MSLRLGFALAILAAAIAYTWIAFTDLSFMIRGRLGPGFFPRAIGIATIAITAYTIFVDVIRRSEGDGGTEYWRDILVFFAYCVGFVALLPHLGGLFAMIVFMLAALFTFNRGQALINVVVSVVLPVGLYLLFDVWLNASFAQGRFPLPW